MVWGLQFRTHSGSLVWTAIN